VEAWCFFLLSVLSFLLTKSYGSARRAHCPSSLIPGPFSHSGNTGFSFEAHSSNTNQDPEAVQKKMLLTLNKHTLF
jgi:hypothetical protein